MTRVVKQQSIEQMIACVPDTRSGRPLIRQLLLNGIEQGSLQNRRLFARQDLALESDLSDVEPVAQKVEQRSPFERDATTGAAG